MVASIKLVELARGPSAQVSPFFLWVNKGQPCIYVKRVDCPKKRKWFEEGEKNLSFLLTKSKIKAFG